MAILEAFLDGVTGAGLFKKRNWPGAPTELIDSRPLDVFMPSIPALIANADAASAGIIGKSANTPRTPRPIAHQAHK